MSQNLSVGIQTQVFYNINQYSNHWAISPVLTRLFPEENKYELKIKLRKVTNTECKAVQSTVAKVESCLAMAFCHFEQVLKS